VDAVTYRPTVAPEPPPWSGERLVSRQRVAEVLGCCTATVSRRLGAYCVVVGTLHRYDLGRILADLRRETGEDAS
jgi:hypothetical protein